MLGPAHRKGNSYADWSPEQCDIRQVQPRGTPGVYRVPVVHQRVGREAAAANVYQNTQVGQNLGHFSCVNTLK